MAHRCVRRCDHHHHHTNHISFQAVGFPWQVVVDVTSPSIKLVPASCFLFCFVFHQRRRRRIVSATSVLFSLPACLSQSVVIRSFFSVNSSDSGRTMITVQQPNRRRQCTTEWEEKMKIESANAIRYRNTEIEIAIRKRKKKN